MSAEKPYIIIFYEMADGDLYSTWEFDKTGYETAKAAFAAALEKYPYYPVRIVKLCYPEEG